MRFLDRPLRFDSFDRFFEMVHGPNPWSTELSNAMCDASFAIPFARGEGYLLHDRQWLHGRKPVSGAVRSFRFHRLVFG